MQSWQKEKEVLSVQIHIQIYFINFKGIRRDVNNGATSLILEKLEVKKPNAWLGLHSKSE